MGRAQAAYGPSFDHSRSFDRFTTQDVLDDGSACGISCAYAAGAGPVLPSTAAAPASPPSDGGNAGEAVEQVVLWDLWYQLPKEEQVRFGDCFSRMILKILKGSDGERSEDDIW